ncbi:alpha/beta-hydrolase [Trametes gibbosa]|nr:alpha/beta-hydrolase [Trametes gibbosa]
MSPTSPLHVLEDSGIPTGSSADYTTIVIVHGYGYNSAIFEKLIPLGAPNNARIILVNRRDYPRSKPYTTEERAPLLPDPLEGTATADSTAAAKRDLDAFMLARGQEVYELLKGLIKTGNIPIADRENRKGGIIVAGWSMGTAWMTALLAYAASLSSEEPKLSDYIQQVVFLGTSSRGPSYSTRARLNVLRAERADAPYQVLGYVPPPPGLYNPLFDVEIALEAREDVFAMWVSGYFLHGSTPETLALREYQKEPPPTLSLLTPEEAARIVTMLGPSGSDGLLAYRAIQLETWRTIREAAMRLGSPSGVSGRHGAGGSWADVGVRCVTCEHSICDCVFTRMGLENEVAEAREQGVPLRDVQFVMIKGANHFVQWLQPEIVLCSLMGVEEVLECTH